MGRNNWLAKVIVGTELGHMHWYFIPFKAKFLLDGGVAWRDMAYLHGGLCAAVNGALGINYVHVKVSHAG